MRLEGKITRLAVAGALLLGGAASARAACSFDRQATSTHGKTVKLFRKCSQEVAKGGTCNQALRDAQLQGIVAKGAARLLGDCGGQVQKWGFASVGDLAGQQAGNAAGEGRHLVDLVYGREPTPLSADAQKCARSLVVKSASAIKKTIQFTMGCAPNCPAGFQALVDSLFADAEAKIAKACSPAALGALVGGDLPAFIAEARASGERVAASRTAKPKPAVNVITPAPPPAPNVVFNPSSLPASIDTAAILANVGSQAYVTSLEVNGHEATYNPVTKRFEHDLLVTNFQKPDFPIFFQMRTTRGTFVGTSNLKISLAGLAPDVIITGPTSGTITSAGTINVTGIVLNLANAGPLFVAGLPTTYATGGIVPGFFIKSVPVGPNPVQIIEAEIHASGVSATNTDSIVVLKGTALDVDQLVPNAVSIRVNDSGFAATKSKVLAEVEPILEPSELIGISVNGSTICDFSHGDIDASLEAAGPQAMRLDIDIEDFYLDVCFQYLAANCTAHYVAQKVEVTTQFDFVSVGGSLAVDVGSTTTNFVNDGFGNPAFDGPPECVNGMVLGGAHAAIEAAIASVAEDEVPPAIEDAVSEIDIGTPLAEGLGMELVGLHLQPLEDTSGVTFRFDANASEIVPVSGGLPLPQFSLLPAGGGTPILNATIPGTTTGYGLGLWVSDGFLNRYVTALFRAGALHLNLSEVPVPNDPDCSNPSDPDCTKLPLDSGILNLIFDDPAYHDACSQTFCSGQPNCPACSVYIALQPTAGGVVRPANPGENGDFVLVIPNYRADAVSFVGFGEVLHYVGILATFEIPITLDVSADTITPVPGPLVVTDVSVVDNPIGADESKIPPVVAKLFPLAAGAIAGSFSALPLPAIEGLQLEGVGSGYNVAGSALYMDLSP